MDSASRGTELSPFMTCKGAGPPVRPRRADVIAAYDLGVERYDQLWSPVILSATEALIPWLQPAPHAVVVDVGAGTGALADKLRPVGPATLIALDASAAMLRVAHLRRGLPAVQADAMRLPVAPASADVVVLAYVLFHLADPLAALNEAARVVRPGGRVGTITWAWERNERAQQIWDEILAAAHVPAAPLRRVDAGLDTAAAIDSKLRTAGLEPLRIWPERLRHQWDPDSFFALVSGSGPNRQRLAALGRDARNSLLARVKERFNQLPPEEFRWEGQVICAVATKPPSHE